MINELFYEIKLFKAIQEYPHHHDVTSKVFYSGNVNVKDIYNMFTLSPIIYNASNIEISSSTDHHGDLEGDYDYFIKAQERANSLAYQRELNTSRVVDIKKYLETKEDYGHFIPNSILLALKADMFEKVDDFEEYIKSNRNGNVAESEFKGIFLVEDNDVYRLFINKQLMSESRKDTFIGERGETFRKILIIDGNHRIEGVHRFMSDNNINKFEIPVSILINMNIKDEAEIFTTVNYESKPVNKSYLYQILGEFDIGKEEHIYLHKVITYFNEKENSPFYFKIKMLGKTYGDKRQSVSQSFFIEHIYERLLKYRMITKTDGFRFFPVLRYYYQSDKKICSRILIRYFNTVRKVYKSKRGEEWFSSNNELLRPIGLGVIIELFPLIFINSFNGNLSNLDEIEKLDFTGEVDNLLGLLYLNGNVFAQYTGGVSLGVIRTITKSIYTELADEQKLRRYGDWYNANLFK